MKKLLIDNDFLLTILNKDNPKYHDAFNLLQKIQNTTIYLCFNDIIKTLDFINFNFGIEMGQKVCKKLLKQRMFFIFPDEKIMEKTNQYFLKNKNHNYEESLNLTIFENYNLDYILSFNKNYQKKLLPLI